MTRASIAVIRTKATTKVAPRPPQTDVPAELTDRIERVATELFIRNGYHGVSYLGIAKELGITHSNVHYYYRNKSALAEAVLRRFAAETLASTSAIWRNADCSLAVKFVLMRNWIYESYLRFNPEGEGGRPWGLLTRFSMEAEALSPEMKQVIRATLKKLEADVRQAVEAAIKAGELRADSPVDGISLQILSVMHLTGQLTRSSSGFSRLDELLMWTINTLYRAYGTGSREVRWPAPGEAPAPVVERAGRRNVMA